MERTCPDRRAELDGSILIGRPDRGAQGREGGLATRGNSKNPHAWYLFRGANQLNPRLRSSLVFQVLAIASERTTPLAPGGGSFGSPMIGPTHDRRPWKCSRANVGARVNRTNVVDGCLPLR